jgi:hypothetical protein
MVKWLNVFIVDVEDAQVVIKHFIKSKYRRFGNKGNTRKYPEKK